MAACGNNIPPPCELYGLGPSLAEVQMTVFFDGTAQTSFESGLRFTGRSQKL